MGTAEGAEDMSRNTTNICIRMDTDLKVQADALFAELGVNLSTAFNYWHYYTGESSKAIFQTAGAETMNECWLGFHTFDVKMAIDDLKELSFM